jgi:hypothetical protein
MLPTVGQDVWLFKGPTQYNARITAVHSETLVDVMVEPGTAGEWGATSVQKGNVPPATFYWEEKPLHTMASPK